MDIGEDEHFRRRWQPAGLTLPRYQKRFYAGGAVTGCDGATAGCAYSRQTIIREILYYVLTGPCGGALLDWSAARLTSA